MKFGTGSSEIAVNVPTRSALFHTLRDRLNRRDGFALATINLDHLTKLPVDPAFLKAYKAHNLVVADGRPIVWLARLAGTPVDLMPGSELIVPLCALCAELQVPVALVGSSDAALAGASKALTTRVPGLAVAYVSAPPYGFDPEGAEATAILSELAASGAGLCFIALGAPKQEIFAAFGRDKAPRVGFASIGAGLDFLSGHQVRAPKILRVLALEWLWRAAENPRRMVPRYAKCFAILPRLVAQALRQRIG
ncbi:WecB/TagA/CpsF family glycosyltransferase [Sulfitobacter aestuariivivens]|uniref:WecB/TagA/CpsF family glycosyltransferase n=1 Tax=Sulfitobacter aestuariivivens TaxID=2766981 RepID=A0A927HCB3_9RHOB|nr:WecB/TagA/CpsF family glycosyltransferase [Sulfitobacter aestuariivivens]